jgi:hypothetical protein
MKRILTGRSIAYVAVLILLILLLRSWIGKEAAREVIRDLTLQLDSTVGNDTVRVVDTLTNTVERVRYRTNRVYVNAHGTINMDSLLSSLSSRDSVKTFSDTIVTDSATIWYDAYLTGRLHAISIGYDLPPPVTISELLTVTKTVQDVRARVWLGAFTDRRVNRYGVSLSVEKQKFQLGTLYDVNGGVLMMDLKYRIR